jgi:FkbM family methyltransferase
MRPSTLGFKIVRRLKHWLEPASTWFETRHARVAVRGAATHRERAVLLELRSFLDAPDMTVYDIGASYGDYTCAFAKAANVARVYAFEPIPAVFRALTARTAALPQVTCLNLALGDTSGSATFHESAFSYSSSMLPMEDLHKAEFPESAATKPIEVKVERLDDVVARQNLAPPDFLKLDVQGFEDRVLKGGEATVRAARYCMLEMSLFRLYQGAPLFDDIYVTMRRLGFTLVAIAGQVHGVNGQVLQVDGVFRRDDPGR